MIPNPWIILGAVLFLLAAVSGAYWLGDNHGTFVERAAQTAANLAQAKKDLADHQKNDQIADKAGREFEDAKPQIIKEVHDRVQTIRIPPDADPFLPVWFVRMFDRLASEDPTADPYPGQSDSAPSGVRLSGTRPVLTKWVEKYETCRRQVDGTYELKPVLPAPPVQEEGFFGRNNPFR